MEPYMNLFYSIFFIGAGLLYLARVRFLYVNGKHLNEWHVTRGRVSQSKITRSNATYYYSPSVIYDYKVGNIEYVGSSINLNGKRSLNIALVQKWISPYPAGKEVNVYYNPDNPKISVLETEHSVTYLVIVFLMGIFLITMGISFFFTYYLNGK